MPLFHYKALDESGKKVEGNLEAKDRFDLYHSLKSEGNITVLSTKEIKSKKSFSFSGIFSFVGGVGSHEKVTFARNLGAMIDAGLPLTRGLSIIERQSRGTFKKIVSDLNISIGKGNTLSDSMKNYPGVFTTLFISMVKAGEESGNLSSALKNISTQLEKSYQLTRKVRGALIYPAVIIFVMIVITVLMMVYMVPTLTETFVGLKLKLPLSTRIIIGISNFLKDYLVFVIIGAILSVFGLFSASRTALGKKFIDGTVLYIPIIGEIIKQVNAARTARTLSSLLSSGVDIVVAIGVTKEVIQNYYYKEVLEKIQNTIQKGSEISNIFLQNERLYPLFVGEMIAVGEETGKIGDMLSGVADFYEEEVDQKTKDMSSVIEPFLMVFIGLAVGFFAVSMISPIYSITDSIN